MQAEIDKAKADHEALLREEMGETPPGYDLHQGGLLLPKER